MLALCQWDHRLISLCILNKRVNYIYTPDVCETRLATSYF